MMRYRSATYGWIGDEELNARSGIACKRIENEAELADLHRQVACASQALVEFADLTNFTAILANFFHQIIQWVTRIFEKVFRELFA